MSDKRNIAVVTGSRAEFGLLKHVLQCIKDDEQLNLQLYATGMHIEGRFGRTITEITEAGFEIAKQVDIFFAGRYSQRCIKIHSTCHDGFC